MKSGRFIRRSILVLLAGAAGALPETAVAACAPELATSTATADVPSGVERRGGLVDEGFLDSFESFDTERFWRIDGRVNHNPRHNIGWSGQNALWNDGCLVLLLTDEPYMGRDYTAASVRTHDFYAYGRYEVTMKPLAQEGTVSAFFTYTGPSFGDPHDEIDIEFLGKDTTTVEFNYFTGGKMGNKRVHNLGFDAAQSFNTYGFEWYPDRIVWFVNGRPVHSVTVQQAVLPQAPGRIFTSLWAGRGLDKWLGPFSHPGGALSAAFSCISFRRFGSPDPHCSDLAAP